MLKKVMISIIILFLFGFGCGRKEIAKKEIVIEVSVMEGAFGLDFYQQVARAYEKEHPGIKVNVWGDPQNNEKLRPRFVSGNPPELVWAHDLNPFQLSKDGLLYPLNDALETKAYGENKKWKDVLVSSSLKPITFNGKIYGIPSYIAVWGIWYNVKMFKKNNWQIPQTWNEFLNLCEKIKQAGIAPLALQGRYQYQSGIHTMLLQRIMGLKKFYKLQNLTPGLWLDSDCIEATKKTVELLEKGYFQEGCLGMTHTEAQMEFVRGKTAMVTCFSWLKAEMANVIPPDFEMACFPFPKVEGGKGEPQAISIKQEYWHVPAQAKYPEKGVDFLKFLMSSKWAEEFVKQKDALVPVRGCEKFLSPVMESIFKDISSTKILFSSVSEEFYPEITMAGRDAITALFLKEITPKEYCQRMEEVCEKVRKDPAIPKVHIE